MIYKSVSAPGHFFNLVFQLKLDFENDHLVVEVYLE